ncbi:MAG: hypothetical protein CMD68_03465 [Gammaproteobacteria bacterium]|nr:hypothetical protein [Gammaproteobacteria bacterium]
MKIIFYIFSIFPLNFAFRLGDSIFKILPLGIIKRFSGFKITKINLSIVFPKMNEYELEKISKESYKESLKSIYETFYTWSRSSKKIIYQTKKINDRFLFNPKFSDRGLIVVGLHNRSIDFMLRWISSQRSNTSLYKKIKFESINRFVKKLREEGNCKMVETGIGGVKSILASLENNEMTCMASDQVPADGFGSYSKFFDHECYSFDLAPKLARKCNTKIILGYLSYKKEIGHILNFKNFNNGIYSDAGVDIMNKTIEEEIRKSPLEYSWEYKKFRKLSSKQKKDIYKN